MRHLGSQGSCDRYQCTPAPPPHVLGSSRDEYIANIFTACGFSHNDSQHFRNLTVESQEQWIGLLESYQNKKFREFTPGYEELPEILEKLLVWLTLSSSFRLQAWRTKFLARDTKSIWRSSVWLILSSGVSPVCSEIRLRVAEVDRRLNSDVMLVCWFGCCAHVSIFGFASHRWVCLSIALRG